MTRSLLSISLCTMLFGALPVDAYRFYVDPEIGDNRRHHSVAQTSATPWRTISHALTIAKLITKGRPHIIDIVSGTYSPSRGEDFPFVIDQSNIYLESAGNVVFDPQGQSRALEITVPTPDFNLRNFSFVNGVADSGAVIYCNACTLEVVDSHFLSNKASVGGDGIFMRNGKLTFTNNTVRLNGADGDPSRAVLELHNTFEGITQGDLIRNNTFYRNNSPVILATGNSTEITNNIFMSDPGNQEAAILDSAVGFEPWIRYNLFWDTDIIYLSDDRDSTKVTRVVRDTTFLEEVGVFVPDFVTNEPDTVAQVDIPYEFDVQVSGNKTAYKFTPFALPPGVDSGKLVEDGAILFTPALSDTGRHEVRVEIITPQGTFDFLTYNIRIFTAENFPDTSASDPEVIVSFVPDTTGALASLNSIIPSFSTAASSGHNLYDNPDFFRPSGGSFLLNAGSPARDSGLPIVALMDANRFGEGSLDTDMGAYGGPRPTGPPSEGTAIDFAYSNIPDSLAIEGAGYEYDPVYTPQSSFYLIEMRQGPPTMADAFGTGVRPPVTWTPTLSDTGSFLVSIEVFTAAGSGLQYFPLRVRAANEPPRVISTPPTTAVEDSLFSYVIEVADADSDAVSFAVLSGPEGLNVDSIGTVTWLPLQADLGNASAQIRITDDAGSVNTHAISLTVSNTNDAPIIEAIPDTTLMEDVEFSLSVTATDEDLLDSVFTFALAAAPDSAALDSLGVLTWTPLQSDVGQDTISVVASDPQGASDTLSFTVIVSEVNDPPAIISDPNTTAFEDQLYEFTVGMSDEEGSRLTFALATAPAQMAIDTAGVITWTPLLADVGNHNIAVTVTDSGERRTTQEWQLVVSAVNDAPVVTSRTPKDAIISPDPYVEVEFSATADDEEGDDLSFQWFVDGVSQSSATATFSYVPDTTTADTVTLHITDGTDTTAALWFVDARTVPRVSVATDTVKFSETAIGDTAVVTIAVGNAGKSVLTLSSLQVINLSFGATFASGQLAGGGETNLDLRFVPALRGVSTGSIHFGTDDPEVPNVTIPVQGTGVVPTQVVIDCDPAAGSQSSTAAAVRAGEEVTLDVYATDVLESVSYLLELVFDPSVFTASFSEEVAGDGNLLGDAGNTLTSTATTISDSLLRVNVSIVGTATPADGDGPLGRFTLQVADGVTAGATSTVRLSRAEVTSNGIDDADVLRADLASVLTLSSAVVGDFSGDGRVDFDDFFRFADAFGSSDLIFDLDGSGVVDFDDFVLFADVFGNSAKRAPDHLAAVEPIDGLSLSAQKHPREAGELVLDLLWNGDSQLRGAGGWVEFDAKQLRWIEAQSAVEEALLRAEEVSPGVVRLATATTSGNSWDHQVVSLRFERMDNGGQVVRLASPVVYAEGAVGSATPPEIAVDALPDEFVLLPAYPNPFNPETIILFFVPDGSPAQLVVHDVLGRQVTVLAEGELIPGYHRVVWDGRDTQGRAVAAGVYLVELRTAQQRLVHKLMLLK
ncbi:MAG: putative Ig domain-containing protein [Candidatus Latescibacterota bacterium]|nr:putative Ig domain-containing protein [Candidatus Latescibacterota bacterium]